MLQTTIATATTQVTQRISVGLAKRAKAQPSPVCARVPHLGQRHCAARVPVGRRRRRVSASRFTTLLRQLRSIYSSSDSCVTIAAPSAFPLQPLASCPHLSVALKVNLISFPILLPRISTTSLSIFFLWPTSWPSSVYLWLADVGAIPHYQIVWSKHL